MALQPRVTERIDTRWQRAGEVVGLPGDRAAPLQDAFAQRVAKPTKVCRQRATQAVVLNLKGRAESCELSQLGGDCA